MLLCEKSKYGSADPTMVEAHRAISNGYFSRLSARLTVFVKGAVAEGG